MKSHVTARFRKAFSGLPPDVQRQARRAYRLFQRNPQHPSLQFKRIHSTRPIYSVRVSLDVRALGVRTDDDLIWFWIGSHADYEKVISRV